MALDASPTRHFINGCVGVLPGGCMMIGFDNFGPASSGPQNDRHLDPLLPPIEDGVQFVKRPTEPKAYLERGASRDSIP